MHIVRRFFPRASLKAAKRLDHEIEILHNSVLVDAVWYRRSYPDLANTPVDVARHYIEYGAKEGRNPHPLFDTNFYLERNPDVAEAGANPLVHYILYGATAGCDPHPLFDTSFYLEKNPDVAASGVNPLAHYILHGANEGRHPHPLFDAGFYLAQSPDVAALRLNPLAHYIQQGATEGRDPSPLFNTKWYLSQCRDIGESNPLVHFVKTGVYEDLDPHPMFDVDWYRAKNPDVAKAGLNPLVHYIKSGGVEGCAPSLFFDSAWFLRNHTAAADDGGNPLLRYLAYRAKDGPLPDGATATLAGMKIAVVVHCFYEDIWREIAKVLTNIPIDFDLFVTVPKEANAGCRAAILRSHPEANILEVGNAGRDVGPFVALMPALLERNYSAICKIHTKKGVTKPSMDSATWRFLLLHSVLGSPSLVANILGAFQTDPDLWIVGAKDFYISGPAYIGGNSDNVQKIAKQLFPGSQLPADWGFFAGTMFWARPEMFTAVVPLINNHWEFEHEPAPDDGQVAHALERVFGLIPTMHGKRIGLTNIMEVNSVPDVVEVRQSPATPVTDGVDLYLKRRSTELSRGLPASTHPSDRPKVSVVCIAYNHEKYIEQAISGFLMQQLDCTYEIIIADDCSTDRTAEIVERYARSDSRIVPVLRKNNIGAQNNFAAALSLARGVYVALCEGDDYWTDPNKLQLQVDFLDSNPEHSICFHPVEIVYENKAERVIFPERKTSFALIDLVIANFIQTNSVMYRWRYSDNILYHHNVGLLPGDWHLHLMHAEVGRIGFIDRTMAVYRRHSGGMWWSAGTLAHRIKYGHSELAFFRDVKTHFGGKYNSIFTFHERTILDPLIEYAVLHEDYDFLLSLISGDSESAQESLAEIGFELATLDISDRVSLEISLRAQNRISVVILSYNHADTIDQCIESVFAQTGPFELEVIIGDDGSTDGTAEPVLRKKAEHPREIKLTGTGTNVGMLANLKRTLQACTGRYIAFCEADDYWLSRKKLLKQLLCISKAPHMSMCFNWLVLEEVESGTMYPHPQQAQIANTMINFSDLARDPVTASFSCCFYRASVVRQVPDEYFRTPGAADWLFNLHIAKHGQIGFIKELLSVYRIHKGGQWSGLDAATQQRRFREARQHALEVFGPGRGLDASAYRTQIRPLHSLDRTLIAAHLDDPHDNLQVFLGDEIYLRGWLLHLEGKPLRLIIRSGNQTTHFDLNRNRPDVLSLFNSSGSDIEYFESCIGFSTWIRLVDKRGVELRIESPDRVIRWKKIEIVADD